MQDTEAMSSASVDRLAEVCLQLLDERYERLFPRNITYPE
jgi:hypothetical protein